MELHFHLDFHGGTEIGKEGQVTVIGGGRIFRYKSLRLGLHRNYFTAYLFRLKVSGLSLWEAMSNQSTTSRETITGNSLRSPLE